jgi:A/G-specific adenine glycosylase
MKVAPDRRSRGTRIFLLKNRSARAVALRKAPRTSVASLASFRSTVWGYWKKYGRHDLPWRHTRDPYKILVSEVMLQQTQVPRVIEKYREFLKAFPTARSLANASLADVVRAWSGLGYNRRAKYLRESASILAKRGARAAAFRETLPGVGPYTRSAVLAFAWNEPGILLETNIRTVFIHHFFEDTEDISDAELLPLIETSAEGQDPREWNWALMDYGAHLKKLHKNPARKSAHHVRQSKFEGSLRQVRGAVLRALHGGARTNRELYSLIRANKRIVHRALDGLAHDGLIAEKGGQWSL